MKTRSAIGFTLIELMVTVTMIAIVLTVGMPTFRGSIRNSVLTAGINEFIAALNFARGEAIKRGVNVTARKSSVVGWEGGWQVFMDVDANGQNDSSTDQVLRTHGPLNANYTLRGNNNFVNYISYQPNGASNTIGSFALCDASSNAPPTTSTARLISIDILGRITMATDNNGNGILTYSSGTPFTSCTSP